MQADGGCGGSAMADSSVQAGIDFPARLPGSAIALTLTFSSVSSLATTPWTRKCCGGVEWIITHMPGVND